MGLPGGSPWTAPPRDPSTEVARLRAAVARHFPVYETRITPQSLILLVHTDPATLEAQFDQLRQELWGQYYIPQLRYQGGEYLVEVVRRPNRVGWGVVINVILLALTVLTTVSAGAFLWLAYVGGSQLSAADFLYGGAEFALPLLAILGLHELAHFVTARRHHVEASLPFFIPVPPPFILFGTFGAFISLREPIPDKKALLDIGASGPLAGFAVAVPVTLFGLFLSAHAPVLSAANCGPSILGVSYGNFFIGSSFVWFALAQFLPLGLVNLSPVALAGWVGLLVTAINLLPAGQLDGGHVFRALLGDRAKYVSYAAVVLLFALGLLAYDGWLIFALLILFLGMRHPPPLNDLSPLDARRWGVGLLAVGILVSGFVLVPIATPSYAFNLTGSGQAPATPTAGEYAAVNLSVTVSDQDLGSHAYLVSGQITGVGSSNGTGPPTLNQSQLAAFAANSTWTVYLPDGNVTTFPGGVSFSEPRAAYFVLNGSSSATVTVKLSYPSAAVVLVQLTISELCSGSPPMANSASFTIP